MYPNIASSVTGCSPFGLVAFTFYKCHPFFLFRTLGLYFLLHPERWEPLAECKLSPFFFSSRFDLSLYSVLPTACEYPARSSALAAQSMQQWVLVLLFKRQLALGVELFEFKNI